MLTDFDWATLAIGVIAGASFLALVLALTALADPVGVQVANAARRRPVNPMVGKIGDVLAAFAVFLCLHQGAYALLFWIPSEWGRSADMPARFFVAATFAVFGGLSLIARRAELEAARSSVKQLTTRVADLEAELSVLRDPVALRQRREAVVEMQRSTGMSESAISETLGEP